MNSSYNNELLPLLQRLVTFRTDITEAAQADWLRTLTTGWGGSARVDEVLPGRVNFIATFAGCRNRAVRKLPAFP